MESWPAPPLIDLPTAPGRLRLFDTAVEDIVEVGPATGTARSFVCGITPYDATHLGHANTYLAFDLMHRQWLDCGLDVHYVQNVTDVDDPLLERAAATGIDWQSLAAEQTQLFRDDMVALNVIPPTGFVAVSEVIEPIADYVARLAEKGAAYQVPGEYADWYFDVTAGGGLGNVNHFDADRRRELFAEFGGDPERSGKRNATDPLLWTRPGVSAPRDERRALCCRDRRTVRETLRALRDGGPGWGQDEQITRQPGVGIPVARGERSDGDPARDHV